MNQIPSTTFIRIAVLLGTMAFVVAGCAHAPKVTHVNPGSRTWDASSPYSVYYALPKTIIDLPIELKIRHVEPGVLQASYAERCQGGIVVEPDADGCFWRFHQPQVPGGHALSCQPPTPENSSRLLPKVYVYAGSPLKVSARAVPDASRIYEVDLHQPAFERLKIDLEISASSAPVSFLAQSETLLRDVIAASGRAFTSGRQLFAMFNADDQRVATVEPQKEPDKEFKEIVRRMNDLELQRRRVANEGRSIAAIELEINHWRTVVQGRVVERSVAGRLAFKPDAESKPNLNSSTEWPMKVEGEKFDFPACSSGAQIVPKLVLSPEQHSLNLIKWQDTVTDESKVSGFRYRTALEMVGSLQLGYCAPNNTECAEAEQDLPLQEPVAVAQWGIVRSLPRRIGFGAGQIGASFDSGTGALKKVSTDSVGGSRDVLATALSEASTDHELGALKREAEMAMQRKTICDNVRYRPNRPVPSYCLEQDP